MEKFMMKILFTGFFLSVCTAVWAQNCNCLDDYYFIKDHIEKNHGGFNKKIVSPEEPGYKKFTAELEKQIKNDRNGKYCIAYLKKYILYLQDHHSNITAGRGTVVDETDPASVRAFLQSAAYRNTEVIAVDSAALAEAGSRKKNSSPEGIYFTPDSTYVVALIKNKTAYRDYAAVILRSKTALWAPGQVKFEMKQVNDSLYDLFTSYRNHSINYDQVSVKDGVLQLNGWRYAGDLKTATPAARDNSLFAFKQLDSTTSLITLRSFDAGLTKTLDSFYRAIMPEIKKHRNLIIDVRDNGGGSDRSYSMLMPLLFTTPFESDVMEYYATPANISAYEKYDSALLKRSPGSFPPFKQPVALMKEAKPFSFTHFGDGRPKKIQYPVNKGNPLKIAVVYNRSCASSCESFLSEILHSSKTIRVGENSGGYTGYGNVMNIETPCGNTLSWTTTVYRNQWQYEFVGIPPQYPVPADETDWIGYARKLLGD